MRARIPPMLSPFRMLFRVSCQSSSPSPSPSSHGSGSGVSASSVIGATVRRARDRIGATKEAGPCASTLSNLDSLRHRSINVDSSRVLRGGAMSGSPCAIRTCNTRAKAGCTSSGADSAAKVSPGNRVPAKPTWVSAFMWDSAKPTWVSAFANVAGNPFPPSPPIPEIPFFNSPSFTTGFRRVHFRLVFSMLKPLPR